ncbi:MAG: hypothetical protein HRT72_11465, partial [Flavobacteriales bacterium]|nr:hypothetical protein [Flavobacteriales bacterium]
MKDLKTKIAAYSTVGTSIFFSSDSNAEWIYTDVNPDITISIDGGFYDLDLDTNGVNDIKVELVSWSNPPKQLGRVKIDAGSNGVFGSTGNPFNYPLVMSAGDSVTSYINFLSGDANVLGFMYTYSCPGYICSFKGNFLDVSNKYIGLKFKIGSDWHYGWLGIDVPADAQSFTIRDFSYNSIMDMPLIAGDQTTGVEEHLPTINLYAFNSTIYINLDGSTSNSSMQVYNT